MGTFHSKVGCAPMENDPPLSSREKDYQFQVLQKVSLGTKLTEAEKSLVAKLYPIGRDPPANTSYRRRLNQSEKG